MVRTQLSRAKIVRHIGLRRCSGLVASSASLFIEFAEGVGVGCFEELLHVGGGLTAA